ncbi:MAG: phosphatidate cytidylyltransferase [Parafilimonas sp.]
MKPLVEFILACILIFVAGCSAVAGIFKAGIWTAFFAAASIVGLVLMFAAGSKNKQ